MIQLLKLERAVFCWLKILLSSVPPIKNVKNSII